MKTSNVERRVYYHDTDQGGVVYYANYLNWFEIGRTELLRDAGFDYENIEKEGMIAPVVEVNCSYKQPARYNDIVVIQTTTERIGNSSIQFRYKILRKKDGALIAEGSTVNVFVNMKTLKSEKIPEDLRKALQ